MILKYLLVIGIFALIAKCQTESECNKKKTCGDCIKFGEESCVWCTALNITENRCLPYNETDENWCQNFTVYPQNELLGITAKHLKASTDGGETIQLTPQKLKYKLRPGFKQQFSFTYKPALNYPIDVYYLMDFSYSMRDTFAQLKSQGELIYNALINGTNNVRLGFGSFVDKPALPIADTKIHTAYTFINHLSLSKKYEDFDDKMKNIKNKNESNYDDPEAMLEALMQVMVCKELNWTTESRKVIFVSTDSTYHSAGDGKFVGAAIPNDMKCHIGNPDLQLVQDYPSVGQIRQVASKEGFVIIFAVKAKVKEEYTLLEKHIERSRYTELGGSDSLVKIIQDEYNSLVNKLIVFPEHTSNVELSLTPECNSENPCPIKNFGQIVITGELKVKSCDNAKDRKELVQLSILSLKEKLNIEIDLICDCDCETSHSPRSSDCSNSGFHKCGICYCDKDKSGNNCECSIDSNEPRTKNECKSKDSDAPDCSGRGKCICGKCYCDSDEFRGPYCQFLKKDCPHSSDGTICSGKGRCDLQDCKCFDGWQGLNCECPITNNSCIPPSSDKVCSGNGHCVCGACQCHDKSKFRGPFCDISDGIVQKRCLELNKFAICNYEKNSTLCANEYNHTARVIIANKTEINAKYKKMTWCNAETDDGGIVVFGYNIESPNNTLVLVIQKEKELPPKANIWVLVGSTVGAILLIGLLTLIFWKILVDIYDAREYKKFEKNSLKDGFELNYNPHYVNPAVSFPNPTYNNQ